MSEKVYPVEFNEPEDGDDPEFGEPICEPDEHWYAWSNYCGAKVCAYCGDHDGLANCYCGFGGGRAALDGETIEPEDY